MHSKTRRTILVAGIVAVGVSWLTINFWYVARERVRNPYLKTQNGLTFIAQHDAHQSPPANDFQASWLRMQRRFTHAASVYSDYVFLEVQPPPNTVASDFSATGRSSTGDRFGMKCEEIPNGTTDGIPPGHFFVRLAQTGVPDTYRWIDVTIKDKKGHEGTWRMTRLPTLFHALPPEKARIKEAEQTAPNITVRGRSWWDASAPSWGPAIDHGTLLLVCELRAFVPQTAVAAPSQHWLLQLSRVTTEWEDPSYRILQQASRTIAPGAMNQPKPPGMTAVLLTETQSSITPHPSAQRVVRLQGELNEFDEQEETLIFRNIPLERDGKGLRVKPGGVTQTSPSGIRVHFDAPPTRKLEDSLPQANEVRLDLICTPESGVFPKSPLQKRIGKNHNIQVRANVVWKNDTHESLLTSSDSKTVRLLYHKRPASLVLPELEVTVTQTAQVRSLPISLTLPVRKGRPKEKWGTN